MRVHGVIWAGTRTDRYADTVAFFRETLGLPLVEVAPDFAWAKLPDTSQFEVFGPSLPDHDHFTTGPVPEFLVDDVHAAAAELRAAGCELLSGPRGTEESAWLHFRAPDGCVYGLTGGTTYARPQPAAEGTTDGVRRYEGEAHGSAVSFEAGAFAPGTGRPPHRHPYDETVVVEEGTATLTVGERTFDARTGDVVVVPAGTPHGFVAAGGQRLRLASVHPAPRIVELGVD